MSRRPGLPQPHRHPWRYACNLTSDEINIQQYLMGIQGNGELNNPHWGTWMFSTAQNPQSDRLVERYMTRPPAGLYITTSDPCEMNNSATPPNLAVIRTRLSAELDRCMTAKDSATIPMETPKALDAAKRGKHLYFPTP